MKILVTGSSGFLGGRLVHYLDEHGFGDLVLATRDLSRFPKKLQKFKAVEIKWDSQSNLDSICSSVDCIVHLAGMNAGQCAAASKDLLNTDVTSTSNLIDSAVRCGVGRFIYVSSAHVYSSSLSGQINEELKPTNTHPYALNHLKKEQLVINAALSKKFKGIVVRLSNAFGAPLVKESDCWMLLVNDLCKQLAQYKKIELKTTGLQQRDFVSITDVCKGIELLVGTSRENIVHDIFNLGGGWTASVYEMACLIADRYAKQCREEIDVKRLSPVSNCVSALDLSFSIEKLIELGYRPSDTDERCKEIDQVINFCIKNFREGSF